MFFDYYILFFFDQGLIVLVCFFLFLFFALAAENGQLASYLQESQIDTKSKIIRYLALRANMLEESISYADRSILKIKKISGSYGTVLLDLVTTLGYIAAKSLRAHTTLKIRHSLSVVLASAKTIENQINGRVAANIFNISLSSPTGKKFLVL